MSSNADSNREIIHSHAMQSLGTFLNDYPNKNVPNDYIVIDDHVCPDIKPAKINPSLFGRR